MSKARTKLVAMFDTLAHAETVRTQIVTQLAGKDVFQQHALQTGVNDAGQPFLLAGWRFNAIADRDAIRDWLRDQAQNHPVVKNWVIGARLSWHRCTHDEPTPQPCRVTDYAEFVK
mgnify:CR=1 FL=1